jgi:endonuclease III
MRGSIHKRNKVVQVLRGLRRMYGERHWTPNGSGLDTLVEGMLAQNTNMANAERGYRQLRRRFRSWTQVLAAPVQEVQRCIAICGLARMRARRLQALLDRIRAERGRLNIEFLKEQEVAAGYEWLTRFHGIGPKTAAFTLLFAFEHPVLPVDNGVLRVLRRVRLVRPKARDAEAERLLSPLIPRGRHYAMHVLLFTHAKERCRPKNPKCDECTLHELCPFGQRRMRHKPPEQVEAFVRVKRRPAPLARFASAGIFKTPVDEQESSHPGGFSPGGISGSGSGSTRSCAMRPRKN